MALKDEYFTISQVAKEFNVTRQTISRWLSDGDITGEKVGRETLIHKSEVERFRLERMMSEDAEELRRRTISYIQRKYHYTKSDSISLLGFDGKAKTASLIFSGQKQGNKYEIINITIGRASSIVDEDDSSIVVGMKIPVLKISKRKSNEAEVGRMLTKYTEKEAEKGGKKSK